MPPSTTEPDAALRLTVVHPERDARRAWCDALARHLPQARIRTWPLRARATPAESGAGTHFAVGWKPPADFFAEQPDLGAFFVAGAGVDHLLALDGLPTRLPIIRLEDAGMADQMFVYCLHEILRRVTRSGDYEQQRRRRVWRELEPVAAERLRIGVLGLGALGGDLAQRLAEFGFPVSGFARQAHALPGVTCFHGAAQWPDFLRASDVLILMAPLTPETRQVIDAAALAQLPRGAWLINVARGGLIDDAALLAALDTAHLAGATLDVFQAEPLPREHPFWRHPRIRLTPHVSAQTLIDPGARQIAEKILRLQQGKSVSGIVHRQRGY